MNADLLKVLKCIADENLAWTRGRGDDGIIFDGMGESLLSVPLDGLDGEAVLAAVRNGYAVITGSGVCIRITKKGWEALRKHMGGTNAIFHAEA